MRHVCLPVPLPFRLFARIQKLSTHWEISIKCDIGVSVEILSRKLQFHYNVTRVTVTLHEHLRKFSITSRSAFLRMRKVLEKIVEKTKTQFYVQLFSPEKSCRLSDNVEKYGRDRQAKDTNILWRVRIATN